VLLIDVSGSMRAEDKLPLLQQALTLLVEQLRPIDRIALVTYSGQSEVVLPSTSGGDKVEILAAIQELEAGGGTAGEAGIHTAYQIAEDHFIPNGNNRVIMATDGDFNLGVASQDELIALIEEKRDSGVLLTTIGTGSGNYQEGKMEQLANHGNGTYEYLDDLTQARKLFVQEYSKLFTVAIDVKVQVIFNPTLIQAYRLIGYENRTLDQAEFERDSTDAGEIGAGQTITALYEVVPQVDASTKDTPSFTVQFRYKKKPQSPSRRLSLAVVDQGLAFEAASEDHRWASAMASAALVLRASTHRGTATFATVLSWMEAATEHDPYGYREEAIKLMRKAQELYN
jgi:Ca-activated chloride channel homolog